MITDEQPILYVKSGCPWCEDAIAKLHEFGVPFTQKNVSFSVAAFEEMRRKSGQTKAPTLDWHGKILADFGADELIPFLRQQKIPSHAGFRGGYG